MLVQELIDVIDELVEILLPCEGSRKSAVDKEHEVFAFSFSVLGLNADIQKAYSIQELDGWRDSLATDRRESLVVRWTVVCTWDR